MIKYEGFELERLTKNYIRMTELKKGQVAFVPSENCYVLRYEDRFVALTGKKSHGESGTFAYWGYGCKIPVRILSPGEKVIVSFSNDELDDRVYTGVD